MSNAHCSSWDILFIWGHFALFDRVMLLGKTFCILCWYSGWDAWRKAMHKYRAFIWTTPSPSPLQTYPPPLPPTSSIRNLEVFITGLDLRDCAVREPSIRRERPFSIGVVDRRPPPPHPHPPSLPSLRHSRRFFWMKVGPLFFRSIPLVSVIFGALN